MRIEIPQIFWHGNRDRIMSIDFYPNSNVLVTCGAETEEKAWIKLWEIEENVQDNISGEVFINENSMNNPFRSNKPNPFMEDMQVDDGNVNLVQGHTTKIRPRFVSEISGAHTATVNIVRFSPNGMYLATGGDDSAIVVWVQKSRPVEFGSTQEKVTWSNYKILRGHLSDVYDLSWSLDSKYLISGSVDNSAIVWNIEKSKGIQKFNDHSHFVQGVSWDPRNKYVVTQSSDKSVRFYKNANLKLDMKFFYLSQMKRIQQGNDNIPNNQEEKNKKNSSGANYNYYFADEIQCPTFVRRHAWSPDGSICLLVAGMQGAESDHVVWGMTRKDLSKPAFYIPTLDKSAVCIRFCPIIFKKDPQNDNEEMEGVRNSEMIDLPYKMVFAIGTLDSIFIYDTQSILPRFAITNIHYQPLTDIAWKGSSMLAASSSDGYITFISFDPEEIGKPIEVENLPEKARGSYELYLSVEMAKNIVSITNGNITSLF